MFGEQCCNRGFDVFVNDKLIVKDFNPGDQQGGINQGSQEALIKITPSSQIQPRWLSDSKAQRDSDYSDHNAIFNAITVRRSRPLRTGMGRGTVCENAWEQLDFKDLSQTGGGDPDNDGLTNAEELAAGSDTD